MKQRWLAGVGLLARSCSRRAATTTAATSVTRAVLVAAAAPRRDQRAAPVGFASGSGRAPIARRNPGSGISSRTSRETDNELVNTAVDQYQDVPHRAGRRARRGDHDVHRRGARRRRRSGQGCVRAVTRVVGADRADRRARSRHRRRRRRARRRLRRSSTTRTSPAGTGSSTCCGSRTRRKAARSSPTSSTRTSRRCSQQLPDLELAARCTRGCGAAELIEEVSEGKITGEEDRYSHTDLWDFAANIEGSKQLIMLLDARDRSRGPRPVDEDQRRLHRHRERARRVRGRQRRLRVLRAADRRRQGQDEGDAGRSSRRTSPRSAGPSAWSKLRRMKSSAATRSFDPGRRRFLRSAAGGAAAVAVGGPALLAECNDDSERPRANRPNPKEAEAREERDARAVLRPAPSGRALARTGVGHRRRVRQPGRTIATSSSTRSASCRPKRSSSWTACRPEQRGRQVPAHRLGRVRRRAPARRAEHHRRRRRVAVRRAVRPRVAQTPRARTHVVHRERPARSGALPRRRVVDDLGRQRRHDELRAAPTHAAHARRVHVAMDARRLQHDPGRLRRGLRARAQPARVQGRHREPRRDRRRPHGRSWSGSDRDATSRGGPRAGRTRRSASSGCSSSSGTGPGSTSRKR